MAEIKYLDRSIFEDTALLSLGQSVSAITELFDEYPDIFLLLGILDEETGRNLWAEEAVDKAAKDLRNLASKIRVERIRQRHRGDAA